MVEILIGIDERLHGGNDRSSHRARVWEEKNGGNRLTGQAELGGVKGVGRRQPTEIGRDTKQSWEENNDGDRSRG